MKSKNAVKRSRSESAKPTREDLLVRILELVKKKPGIRPSEINRALNLEQSDDLRQALIDRGLVRKTKEGREVHLYPR
jgi:predicted transcriptional regulator